MAVTRSTAADRQAAPPLIRAANPRTFELVCLVFASLLVTAALYLTYSAKMAQVADDKPLFLTELARSEQLIPYVQFLPRPRDRQAAARQMYDLIRLQRPAAERRSARPSPGRRPGRCFTRADRADQAELVVRTPVSSAAFFLWAGHRILVFLRDPHLVAIRGFTGEQSILPILHLLTGTGWL